MYHIRRKEKEISEVDVLKKILKSAKLMTIALSMKDQPYLVTLDYGYDENRGMIYFHCADEGKKLDYLEANATVWGQVMLDYGYVEGECNHLFATVHFQGKVTLLQDAKEKRKALECMIRQLDKSPEPLLAKTSKIDVDRLKRTAIGRIDVSYMSGKKSSEVTI